MLKTIMTKINQKAKILFLSYVVGLSIADLEPCCSGLTFQVLKALVTIQLRPREAINKIMRAQQKMVLNNYKGTITRFHVDRVVRRLMKQVLLCLSMISFGTQMLDGYVVHLAIFCVRNLHAITVPERH